MFLVILALKWSFFSFHFFSSFRFFSFLSSLLTEVVQLVSSSIFTMRRAWLKWCPSTDKSKVRPTDGFVGTGRSIQLPAEYLDGFVEIHDDVVVFVDPSLAALLGRGRAEIHPAGLPDVVGKSLTHFALCWAGDERAMSEFSDMASGCRDRCHAPSFVSGKQLAWTALRSRERAGRCISVSHTCQRAVRTGEYYARLASTGLW